MVAAKHGPGGSSAFYTQPLAFGSWTCRVDLVTVAPWIAGNRPKPDAGWDDDIGLQRYYAPWRKPLGPDVGDRVAACKAFRDFDRLNSIEGGMDPERASYLLDSLIDAARPGSAPFAIQCIDKREGGAGHSCNAREFLSKLTFRSRFSARNEKEAMGERSAIRTDTLFLTHPNPLHRDGHPEMVSITIESEQIFGEHSSGEGIVRNVSIEMVTA